jgi:hypothetical protein
MSLAEAIQIGRNRQMIATQLAEMNERNSSARELNRVARGRVQDTRVEQQREVDRGQERGEREVNQVAGGHCRTQGARVEQERGYERGQNRPSPTRRQVSFTDERRERPRGHAVNI